MIRRSRLRSSPTWNVVYLSLNAVPQFLRQLHVGRHHALPCKRFSLLVALICVTFHKRRLPHWLPSDAEFFVTWRLYGSLPMAAHGAAPHPHSHSHPHQGEQRSAGEAFVALDRQLDSASNGSVWLKNARVADSVSRVLLSGMTEWDLYELAAWVVMANHIHVLLRSKIPLGKALMNIKSGSARAANEVLGRSGKPFWQDESFDHWVRNDRERIAIIRYIQLNPVKAGLVAEPEDWPWSSAGWQRMAPPHLRLSEK
jgi:putative transposase